MIPRGSRYEGVPPFRSDRSDRLFPGLRSRDPGSPEGVLEHTVRAGDRLDLLANHYYNNDRLWWRILEANPALWSDGMTLADKPIGMDLSLDLCVGRILVIPRAGD